MGIKKNYMFLPIRDALRRIFTRLDNSIRFVLCTKRRITVLSNIALTYELYAYSFFRAESYLSAGFYSVIFNQSLFILSESKKQQHSEYIFDFAKQKSRDLPLVGKHIGSVHK